MKKCIALVALLFLLTSFQAVNFHPYSELKKQSAAHANYQKLKSMARVSLRSVFYLRDAEDNIVWNYAATRDIKELGNAMLKTEFGEQAFHKWKQSATKVFIVIDRENDPVDRLATTIPSADKFGEPIVNESGQYEEVVVVFYKKSLEREISIGSNRRFEGADYEEALGAIGAHEVYHNEPAQIRLDRMVHKELKQNTSCNLPINAEINFREEYHKKYPGKANASSWRTGYDRKGYHGIDHNCNH